MNDDPTRVEAETALLLAKKEWYDILGGAFAVLGALAVVASIPAIWALFRWAF